MIRRVRQRASRGFICNDQRLWFQLIPVGPTCETAKSTATNTAVLFNKYSTTTIHPFNGLFSRASWVNRYQKGKTSLDLNEARDDGVLGCSGINWTICSEQGADCLQITTTTPNHSIFTGRVLFLTPTDSVTALKVNRLINRPITNSRGVWR